MTNCIQILVVYHTCIRILTSNLTLFVYLSQGSLQRSEARALQDLDTCKRGRFLSLLDFPCCMCFAWYDFGFKIQDAESHHAWIHLFTSPRTCINKQSFGVRIWMHIKHTTCLLSAWMCTNQRIVPKGMTRYDILGS